MHLLIFLIAEIELIASSNVLCTKHPQNAPWWMLESRGLSSEAHLTIPNLRPAEALWLSFSTRLYVLLTKRNEQTPCPNMLHHSERVGLSYRINRGGVEGVEGCCWRRGCTAQWRISLHGFTTINNKCENQWECALMGQWSKGDRTAVGLQVAAPHVWTPGIQV